MKCKYLFLSISAFVLASCGMDRDAFNEQIYQESVKNNAAQKLGVTIDPNHTWSSVTKSSISITADAPLIDIQKVRILTESPFFNDNAEFLAEAEVSKGQTITLDYDAPKDLDRLIAACIDSKGNYYIKGFNPGEKSVSFAKSSRARTRGVASVPDLSGIVLDAANSFLSFNAERTINANSGKSGYDGFKNSGWENDRLWQPTGVVGGWTVDHSTIYTNTDVITEEERLELTDIFNACLYRDDKQGYKGRRDNLPTIREGNAVKFFNNHLVTDGKNPITLIPVQLASTDAAICDIYYYYFKPEDIPSGMSEADYIKTLPKFKAIDLDVERNAFSAQTGIAITARDQNFLRVHEYLLPYYGDPSTWMKKGVALSTLGYNTDGKVYRIKNAEVGKCMTYTTNSVISMEDPYADNAGNIKDQLWQIYRHNNGTIIFYNVGIGKFMRFPTSTNKYPHFDTPTSENDLNNYLYLTADKDNKPTNATEKIHIFSSTKSHVLKSDAKIRVATDANNKTDRATIQWTFEEYGPASTGEATVPFQSNPVINPSPIFAKGYRIGFMVRKNKNNSISESQNGCLYGYGELNRQINTFGQFKSAITDYSMKENDPRIAMFNANGKTYLCFEEGSDAQYSDMIVELGGTATSKITKDDAGIENITEVIESTDGCGIYSFDSEPEVQGIAYTMCFEDRPREADFDMNDVVIQARIIDNNTVQVILVACGAKDRLILQIPGSRLFNNTEIHNLFGLSGNQYYANTQTNGYKINFGIFENINTELSLEEFLKTISLKNLDMDDVIRFQKQGEYPRAIIVPSPFDYPQEKISIMEAYPDFLKWVQNMNESGNWYVMDRDAEKIFPNLFKKK